MRKKAIAGIVCGGLLWFIDWVVINTQFWPAAAFWLPGPSLWQLCVFYALVAAWLWLPPRRWLRVAGGAIVCAWCVFCLLPWHTLPEGVAQLVF